MVKELLQLNTLHKRLIVGLFCALLMLLSAYGVLISRVVMQTMAHNDIDRSLTETASEIAFLEAEYMEAVDTLTLARAHELGFVDASISLFVSRRADTFSFRTGDE